ncbi:3-hydroxyacyl-CoA dehydrogenase/enoyl-CoA hydratase/3-hydroxybutyryl-CoA epimerase [Novosphingobium sp. 1529]|uniref:3-hydroxyacyl-CoA dehydrogenase NAD-binding domain-containing protein n=1 Tax=Novosphingobium sp. 1529 TaxID=3156424 RepID=UPI0033912E44
MTQMHYDRDADGIVTITFDAQGRSANTMSAAWLAEIDAATERLRGEEGLTGVILASAKSTFFAGGDLEEILANDKSPPDLFAWIERNKAPIRALERLDVPVVAAINGAALGGGMEICLGANHRIIVDDPKALVGFPEVTLGLLPGAGGVVRTVAMLGLEKALPLLLEGTRLPPAKALALGLVDAIVPTVDALLPAAKAWIKVNPGTARQAWDTKGFVYPGGGADAPNVRMLATMAPTMLHARTRGLMPAPERILDVAVNSMRMGFDSALRSESRALTALIRTPEARAAITTFFFGMQAIKPGKQPPGDQSFAAAKSAVLGAGMMGAGIAWAHAIRGMPTVLKDVSLERAQQGKAYSKKLAAGRVKKGRMNAHEEDQLLGRITPTADFEDMRGASVIIEAVFEDVALKEAVIAESFPLLADDGIYGSNTSTLPISLLAAAAPDPSRFIGLHFFSPVDKMKIVEIIMGEATSAETLRKARDYVRQIGYTPIVVKDSRGFFTSRVFGTYLDEGQALLRDGLPPAVVERAGWLAGMPVGPLAVHDEVSMRLTRQVHKTHLELDARLGVTDGYPADQSSSQAVGFKMAEMGRGGRAYGGGFYDYHPDGTKTLWDGLGQFAERGAGVTLEEAKDRLLYRQAIEALRCLEEGVVLSENEANLGSIMAIGFPAHTGGAIQFIRGVGRDAFLARADALAKRWGERFYVSEYALQNVG